MTSLESRSKRLQEKAREAADISSKLLEYTWAGKIAFTFIVVFVIQTAITYTAGQETMIELFGFASSDAIGVTLLTGAFLSAFAHGNILHLVINTYVFTLFAFIVETEASGKQMAAIFCISGILASIAQVVTGPIFGGADIPVVGASGGIGALIATAAFAKPNMELTVFIPIPVKTELWKVVVGFTTVTVLVIAIFGSTAAGIGHIAHLTGFIIGGIAGLWLFVFNDQDPSEPVGTI